MEDSNDIIKRIKERNSLIESKITIKKKSNISYKIGMSIMSIFIVFLLLMIYAKKDENGNFLKKTFNIDVSFAKINEKADQLINKFLVFEYNFAKNNDDIYVGLNDSYIEIDDNEFYNSSSKVYAVFSGVVTYVNENIVYIEHDNGVIAKYYNVHEPLVFVYDRVKEYQVIGYFNESVRILFYKDGKNINYEEIFV